MVRLKREIDGIRIDRSVPEPAYTLHPRGPSAVLPGFARNIAELEGKRILVAGTPQLDLAIALAEAGHQVTLTDLLPRDVPDIHARLSQAALGRMNLVDRSYGETTFAPSAFDEVVLLDSLHAYPAAQWLVHKLHRELKIDGKLHARLFVRGALPQAALQGAPAVVTRAQEPALGVGLAIAMAAEALGRRTAGAVVHSRVGREAIDRGAHLPRRSFAGEASAQLEAIASRLRVEEIQIGHSLRCRLAEQLFGLRPAVRALTLSVLGRLPELADAEDRQRELPRVISVVARKSLADMGRFRGRI